MMAEARKCALCGGNRISGTATFSADRGGVVVVIRDVPATICDQCGEEWFEDGVVQALQESVEGARSRGAQIEVTSMSA
jgi:YgiT-type zinc finger domain-containing protein